jgi:Na+-transporting NADH:ubiquinone oxidoreductase subunit NqrB
MDKLFQLGLCFMQTVSISISLYTIRMVKWLLLLHILLLAIMIEISTYIKPYSYCTALSQCIHNILILSPHPWDLIQMLCFHQQYSPSLF